MVARHHQTWTVGSRAFERPPLPQTRRAGRAGVPRRRRRPDPPRASAKTSKASTTGGRSVPKWEVGDLQDDAHVAPRHQQPQGPLGRAERPAADASRAFAVDRHRHVPHRPPAPPRPSICRRRNTRRSTASASPRRPRAPFQRQPGEGPRPSGRSTSPTSRRPPALPPRAHRAVQAEGGCWPRTPVELVRLRSTPVPSGTPAYKKRIGCWRCCPRVSAAPVGRQPACAPTAA